MKKLLMLSLLCITSGVFASKLGTQLKQSLPQGNKKELTGAKYGSLGNLVITRGGYVSPRDERMNRPLVRGGHPNQIVRGDYQETQG
ncbi:MAG: hypothetical protein WD055_00525 [Candidatus Dependentiae bacterium]